MKQLLNIIAALGLIITAIMLVLPLDYLAFIPGIVALVFSIFSFFSYKRAGEHPKVPRMLILIAVILLVAIPIKTALFANEVADDTILEEVSTESENEAIEELNELESLDEIDNEL